MQCGGLIFFLQRTFSALTFFPVIAAQCYVYLSLKVSYWQKASRIWTHCQKLSRKFEVIWLLKRAQSCFLLNSISVISSIFINKFVQKCQYYHTLTNQSILLVTVMSGLSLLTKQLWKGWRFGTFCWQRTKFKICTFWY